MPVLLSRISLLLTFVTVAHAYSPRPEPQKTQALQATLEAGVTCGRICMPACIEVNETTGVTAHSCYSDSHPTVGAVLHSVKGVYVCEMCGVPNRHACECTHDNNSTAAMDPFNRPCEHEVTHWCFFEPQYVVTPTSDGLYWCMANETNAEEEKVCGLEDHEACLDTVTNTYSCASPAADGATIRAVPVGDDAAAATTKCVRCGVAGARACVCNEPPCPEHGGTAWCAPGLEVSSLDGLAYCQESFAKDENKGATGKKIALQRTRTRARR